MGSPKTAGAGSGAVSGAVAGSAFGPIGTGVGAVAGGLVGYFSAPKGDVPQYQPPPPDPEYLALKQQAEQDRITATQQRVQMDSASLMARYGSRLALAGANANAAGASPTLAAPLAPQPVQSNDYSQVLARALPIVTGKVA